MSLAFEFTKDPAPTGILGSEEDPAPCFFHTHTAAVHQDSTQLMLVWDQTVEDSQPWWTDEAHNLPYKACAFAALTLHH